MLHQCFFGPRILHNIDLLLLFAAFCKYKNIGHSDVQTTINRYVHSRDKKKQEAVRSVNEMLAIQG